MKKVDTLKEAEGAKRKIKEDLARQVVSSLTNTLKTSSVTITATKPSDPAFLL